MRIEIPDEMGTALEEIAHETNQDVASLTAEMLSEAIKMRRVPGIVFVDEGITGRRACVPGTRIPVFEIAEYYEFVGRDRAELKRGFDWLKPYQFDIALAYYEAFPEDITPHFRTEEEALADLHRLWEEIPQTSPHWPGRRHGAVSQSPAESA